MGNAAKDRRAEIARLAAQCSVAVERAHARTTREVFDAYRAEAIRTGRCARLVNAIDVWADPALGFLAPSRCDPPAIHQLVIAMRGAGRAPHTIRTTCSAVRAAFTHAFSIGLVDRHPLESLRGVLPPKRVRDSFNPHREVLYERAIERLWSSNLIPYRERVMYLAGATLGLREGEILGAQVRDIDRDNRAMHVERQWSRVRGSYAPPKGGGPRVLPARLDVLDALEHWTETGLRSVLRRRARSTDLLFPEDARGLPQNDRTVLKRFHRNLRRIGMEKRRMHALRHSFATMLIEAGVAKDVIEQLTHPKPRHRTIDDYAHYSWRVLCRAVDQIGIRVRVDLGQLEFNF